MTEYDEGLRDGKISALEEIQAKHDDRLNSHSSRLRRMERVIWIGLGGLFVLQALPEVKAVFKLLGGA